MGRRRRIGHRALLLGLIAGVGLLVAACTVPPYRVAPGDLQGPTHGDSGGDGGGGGSM